ncbi:FecR family protein [Mucilaginibacter sp. SP1R1]|uniref:FecR family protein n=1 Tax=Mucilaginibacter sp. SP1R1 TaxID=2723091 RepID=UPI00161CE78A|nr:FecR family protein [Mucilaginibacter sp. SP1R1]MBB6151118.1 ferric-dicitrate binding protein FerR (iron transport regulator) [Mucilaginibacter sp. SP1R1]
MNKIQLSELLDKYFDGTCAPEEIEAIDQWFDQYERKPDFTKTLSDDKRELLKSKMFNAISARTVIEEPVQKIAVVRSLVNNWWVRVAAAAVLLVVAKFLFIDKALLSNKLSQTANRDFVITNYTKNIVKQILPDSSVVWLSPNASITYPKFFQSKSRNVAMLGNCFFEVTKNPRRPFIINSAHIVTKVWGTSFRVLDNMNIAAAMVTVVTGKVSVSKKGSVAAKAGAKLSPDEVLLLPKQQVVYEKNTDALLTNKQADISALSIYKHIDLSFDNARLTTIVAVLNQKFNVDIKIQDEGLNKAVMTADLTSLNLPEVLEVLKTSMKLNYEISDDLIVLKKTN